MHHDRETGEFSDDSNRRRLGDDLLMDALLEARASDRREDLDRRVAAVMARVSGWERYRGSCPRRTRFA